MTKTSAVPLRKETVKVTLKASDAEDTAAAAPAVPAPAAPPAPSAPPAPKPPTATQGGPPAPPTAAAGGPPRPSAPAPAPTVALRTAAGTTTGAPAPAPTVALRTGGAAPTSLQTQPLTPQGTQALPKATVPLGGTQQLGRPTGLQTSPGTVATFDDDDDGEGNETITTVLAILGFVAALGALATQFMAANVWVGVTNGVSRTMSDFFGL